MMKKSVTTLTMCVAIAAAGTSATAAVHHHHPRHATRAKEIHRRVQPRAAVRYGRGGGQYGYGYDPTPTCRYPDGTPFDPDIIGGPNYVGDGGPAANLGGYDPCGF